MEKILCAVVLLSTLTLCLLDTPKRELSTEINPGCNETLCPQHKNGSSINLIHTIAKGSQDTLHYLWSTIGAPVSLIFLTSTSSQININWEGLLSNNKSELKGAINFTETPIYSSAIIISKLIEFDDVNDNGNVDNWNTTIYHDFPIDNLEWDAINESSSFSSSHAQATFNTLSYNESESLGEGHISLQFDSSGLSEHDETIPKLLRNSNCSQIRLKLTNLPSNLNNSRYGLEVIVLNSETIEPEWRIDTKDTMNDEYTPGVFKAVQISSNASQQGFGTFFTWKPVAYMTEDLTVIDSTDANLNSFQNLEKDDLEIFSLASAFTYFIEENAQKFNVTFGTQADGFYAKAKHISWALVYGVGVPTDETISMLVILTVAFGSGIPLLLMIVSSVYILRLKYKKKQATD